MTKMTSLILKRSSFLVLATVLLSVLSGCKRSEENYDDRTLEKRSHVESVQPVDRKDPFRP